MRGTVLLSAAFAASIAASCSGDGPAAPAAPGGAGAVVSVSLLVGAPGVTPLTVGGTMNVTAWEALAGGDSRDCTPSAAWKTSDPVVARVTSPGTLTAYSAGSAQISATCSGVTGVATVTVFENAALFGSVRDPLGAPLPGVRISVMIGKYGRTGASDGGGAYRVAGIPRGSAYLVYVARDGYDTVSATVTLDAAETRADFTLTPGIVVGGRVTEPGAGPLEGVRVEAVAGANAGQSTVSNERGNYSLHLLPGRVTLRAGKPGYSTSDQTLDLAAGATVDFALTASYGNCLLTVAPLLFDPFPSSGGQGSIAVDANPSRYWTAESDQPWVDVQGVARRAGPGVVQFRVSPSAPGATDNRSALLRVGCSAGEGQNVRLSQLPDCQTTVTWAEGSPSSFTAEGGTGHVLVRTGTPGCHWQAVSRNDWIRTVGVNDWYGDLEAYFTVLPNATGAARTGSIVIGEAVWEVRQRGQ